MLVRDIWAQMFTESLEKWDTSKQTYLPKRRSDHNGPIPTQANKNRWFVLNIKCVKYIFLWNYIPLPLSFNDASNIYPIGLVYAYNTLQPLSFDTLRNCPLFWLETWSFDSLLNVSIHVAEYFLFHTCQTEVKDIKQLADIHTLVYCNNTNFHVI